MARAARPCNKPGRLCNRRLGTQAANISKGRTLKRHRSQPPVHFSTTAFCRCIDRTSNICHSCQLSLLQRCSHKSQPTSQSRQSRRPLERSRSKRRERDGRRRRRHQDMLHWQYLAVSVAVQQSLRPICKLLAFQP